MWANKKEAVQNTGEHYWFIRLRYNCSVPEAKLRCTEIEGLRPFVCWMHIKCYSPEKLLYNRIYCPSNRSKQIKETHMAYSASTQCTRQSLNEKQCTWLHRQRVISCEAMYVVFHSNFTTYIVCQRYKPCEFPGFVWNDCWGNKSYYVITSPGNTVIGVLQCIIHILIARINCLVLI